MIAPVVLFPNTVEKRCDGGLLLAGEKHQGMIFGDVAFRRSWKQSLLRCNFNLFEAKAKKNWLLWCVKIRAISDCIAGPIQSFRVPSSLEILIWLLCRDCWFSCRWNLLSVTRWLVWGWFRRQLTRLQQHFPSLNPNDDQVFCWKFITK